MEFDRDRLVAIDTKTKLELAKAGLAGAAWMMENEARALFGLNETEDGNVVKQPLNISSPDDGGDGDATETEQNGRSKIDREHLEMKEKLAAMLRASENEYRSTVR